MTESKIIKIAAAVITDDSGRLLLVRKRGTPYFMQPGGKMEPGEEPQATLVRELMEELNLVISPEDLTPLGMFTELAANEPGFELQASMFILDKQPGDIQAEAEIEEIYWLSPEEVSCKPLAPLTENKIIPLVWKL